MLRLGTILDWFRDGVGMLTTGRDPVVLNHEQKRLVVIKGVEVARVGAPSAASASVDGRLTVSAASVEPVTGGRATSVALMEVV